MISNERRIRKYHGDDGIPAELFQILKNNAVKVLHSICQQIWISQQWPQDWKRCFHSNHPKNGNAKECSNYHIVMLISHATKVMLKILQARLQQYVNRELPYMQAGFRKGRGTRDQTANICWIIETAREFQKTSTSASLTPLKPLTVWITTNCGKFLEMEIPDHLTCPLRNLNADQEATVRSGKWNNGLLQNWDRSMIGLYIFILRI